MTKYTRESPFEFEGVKVWQDEGGAIRVHLGDAFNAAAIVQACSKFIEAERTGWQWSNDDHTEARNGRWVVRLVFEKPLIHLLHDDMGDQVLARGDGRRWAHTDAANDTMTDFLVWRAEQDVPEEPTGLGSVVEVDGERYVRAPEDCGDTMPWWSRGAGFAWTDVAKRGPVKVLSEGVTS